MVHMGHTERLADAVACRVSNQLQVIVNFEVVQAPGGPYIRFYLFHHYDIGCSFPADMLYDRDELEITEGVIATLEEVLPEPAKEVQQ